MKCYTDYTDYTLLRYVDDGRLFRDSGCVADRNPCSRWLLCWTLDVDVP